MNFALSFVNFEVLLLFVEGLWPRSLGLKPCWLMLGFGFWVLKSGIYGFASRKIAVGIWNLAQIYGF